ncbi:RING finger protein unkempt [Aphelenchoides besseyi]|nr:RING finger protein unkempt [Aphelenchoides besseyi]KAI6217770.1 RING finger protein unkempt [Aphelenchoides besseyi]
MNGSSQKAAGVSRNDSRVYNNVEPVSVKPHRSNSQSSQNNEMDKLEGGNDERQHQSVVNDGGDGMQNEKQKLQNICRWYPQRQFINTQLSVDRDDRYKTAICKLWQTNNCKFGDRCDFAHGEHELRNQQQPTGRICSQYAQLGRCSNGTLCQHRHVQRRERHSKIEEIGKKFVPVESQAVNSTAQWNNDAQLNLQTPTPDSGFYTSPSPAQWTGNWFPNAPAQWPSNLFAYPPPQSFCSTYDPYFMNPIQPHVFYTHIPLPDSLPLSPPAPILNYPLL